MNVELRSRRSGNPTTTRRIYLRTDLRVRGDWQDRSGYRIAGGFVLFGGLAVAGALIGGGVALLNSYRCSGFCVGPFAEVAVVGIGGIVGLAAMIVGPILLAMNDRPILSQERLPSPIAFWAAPVVDGAVLGVVGDL